MASFRFCARDIRQGLGKYAKTRSCSTVSNSFFLAIFLKQTGLTDKQSQVSLNLAYIYMLTRKYEKNKQWYKHVKVSKKVQTPTSTNQIK